MTLLEERPSPAAPGADVEGAVARLVDVVDVPWSPAALGRWVAEQPDPERALGQLLRAAAGTLELDLPVPATAAPKAGGPAALRPVTDPDGLSPARQRRARVCLWVRNAGCLLLVFLAYQWWGTGFEQHRAQTQLRRSFQPASALTAAPAPAAAPADPGPAGAPLAGSAVARLEIPAIALDEYVVEGTGVPDLKQGPGHYSGSPLPGQHGNAAIAGHRTTYGAPFGRLDDLKAGDTIVATTAAGRSVYTVSGKLTVLPTQTSVLDDYGDDRLTLTTCTPKFSASHRLIVVALLQGSPRAGPTATAPAAPTVAPAEPSVAGGRGPLSLSTGGAGGFHLGALPAAVLAALALAGLALLYRPVRRRWPPLAAAAVLTPLWLGGLLVFCEALNRFLPANV
jgi:sortase A